MLGERYPPGRYFVLNLLVLVFVSDAVSLSQVAFNVLDLGLLTYIGVSFSIIIFVVDFFTPSDPDFHFHQLIPLACVIVHVVH